MHSPEPSTTFLCPACGESISTMGLICRFCSKNVAYELQWRKHLPHKQRSEFTKQALNKLKSPTLASYGALRKALEQPSVLAKNVPHYDAIVLQILARQLGGELVKKTALPAHTHKRWMLKVLPMTILICVLSLAGWASYHFLGTSTPQDTEQTDFKALEDKLTAEREVTDLPASMQPMVTQDTRESGANTLQKVLRSTATVMGENTSGSAFFAGRSGFLVTNHHVTSGMKELTIETYDNQRHKARVILEDKLRDLTLLQIDSIAYDPIELGDATTLRPGDTVFTIGAPSGLSFTVTKGIVSFVGRVIKGQAYIQADVAINPGNSGGPMINDRGQVVGINNFILQQTEGLNFAIASNYLYMGPNAFLKPIMATERANQAMQAWLDQEQSESLLSSGSMKRPPQLSNKFKRAKALQGEIKTLVAKINALSEGKQADLNKHQEQSDQLRKNLTRSGMTITQQTSIEKDLARMDKNYQRQRYSTNRQQLSLFKKMNGLYDQLAFTLRNLGQTTIEVEQQKENIRISIESLENEQAVLAP